MADEEVLKNLPDDEHLRQDVASESEADLQDPPEEQFKPGQTNDGQQVSGLASATGYGKALDPESRLDGNNPV